MGGPGNPTSDIATAKAVAPKQRNGVIITPKADGNLDVQVTRFDPTLDTYEANATDKPVSKKIEEITPEFLLGLIEGTSKPLIID